MGSQNGGQEIRLKCPVCAAGFRGVEICPRCGTDLGPVMRIAARAWLARQRSRAEFRTGDLQSALRSSAAAWRLQRYGFPVGASILTFAVHRRDGRQTAKIGDQSVQSGLERVDPALDPRTLDNATTPTESAKPESSRPTPGPHKQVGVLPISSRLATAIRRLQSALLHSSDSQNQRSFKVKGP